MLPAITAAALHHVLAFLVIALLAAELALVRRGIPSELASRISRLDLAYGVAFGLLLIVGLLRVFLFEKGADYYFGAWTFLLKFGLLLAAAAASVPPTLAYLRWSRLGKAKPGFLPEQQEIARVRRFMWLEVALILPVPLLAAMMARGY